MQKKGIYFCQQQRIKGAAPAAREEPKRGAPRGEDASAQARDRSGSCREILPRLPEAADSAAGRETALGFGSELFDKKCEPTR